MQAFIYAAATTSPSPEFAAGFVFGMTGNDYESVIAGPDACYTVPKHDLPSKELNMAMSLLKGGKEVGQIAAGIDYSLYIEQLNSMLGSCTEVQSDLQRISNWADIFNDPELAGRTITENFIKNPGLIEADIKVMEQWWDSADYYKSGMTLAYIANTLIGPIPAW